MMEEKYQENVKKELSVAKILRCLKTFTKFGAPDSKIEPGPWEIPFETMEGLRPLGAGEQGALYTATMRGAIVAVRKIREKALINNSDIRKLNQMNLVKIKGVSTVTPDTYVIMEFCQYGSLSEFLHSGSYLQPGQLMKWAKDVAFGMAYLHQHKIIHRDLRSSKLLVAENMTIKISDFGRSREWETGNKVQVSAKSVAWMAPEVIRNRTCSDKIDIWSFGVVLWEIITREIPYRNLESIAIFLGVGMDTLSLPIPTGCPRSLTMLICLCWQRIPKNRPSFKTIAANLEAATADIAAIDSESFAARHAAWGAEARDGMKKIYARNELTTLSGSSSAAPVEMAPTSHENQREVEQKIKRADELIMEAKTMLLQLDLQGVDIAERENLLMAIEINNNKVIKLWQQNLALDGKPVTDKQSLQQKTKAKIMVQCDEKKGDRIYSIAVSGNIYLDADYRNKSKKDTTVECNGNGLIKTVPVQKPKQFLGKAVIPDVAQV